MLCNMGVCIGKGKQSHQALFHRKMNPGLHDQFAKNGGGCVGVLLVGRMLQALQKIVDLAMLQVDFGNADLEVFSSLAVAWSAHNVVVSLDKKLS